MLPKSTENEAKWHPHGPPEGSRWPKRPHDGNKRLQHIHKEAPRGPMMAIGGSKMALGDPKMVPRCPKTAPRWPQNIPKIALIDGPRGSPR